MPQASDTQLDVCPSTYIYRVAIPYRPSTPIPKTMRHAKTQVQSPYIASTQEITSPIDISSLKQWDTEQFFRSESTSYNNSNEIIDSVWSTQEMIALLEESALQVETYSALDEQAESISPEFLIKHPYLIWSGIGILSVGLFFTFMQLWSWEDATVIVMFTAFLCFLLGITFILRILHQINWRYIAFSILWSGLITYGSLGISLGFNL